MATERLPFGDAYISSNSFLKNVSNRIYEDQLRTEKLQRDESARLENEMKQEIGTIRNVDRDAYIDKYNKYKQLKMRLYNDERLKKNPKEYDAVNREAMQAFADAKTFAGKSAEANDMFVGLSKGFLQNPNAYADDAGKRMSELRSMPLDSIVGSPYSDLTTYIYQGPDANFLKNNQNLGGTPTTTFSARKSLPGGLQEEVTEFKFGATPEQRKSKLMNAFADPRQARMADRAWKDLDKAAVEDVMARFEDLKDEDWEQRTGKKNRSALRITDNMSNAEKYATFQAMLSFVDERPAVDTKTIDNKAAIDERNFQQQKELKNIDLSNRKQIAKLQNDYIVARQKAKDAGKKGGGSQILNEIYTGLKDQAIKGGQLEMNWNGKEKMYRIPNPALAGQSLSIEVNGEKIPPDQMYFKENGGVRYVFYERDESNNIKRNPKTGNAYIDTKASNDITEKEFKLRIARGLLPSGEAVKQADVSPEDDEDISEYEEMLDN